MSISVIGMFIVDIMIIAVSRRSAMVSFLAWWFSLMCSNSWFIMLLNSLPVSMSFSYMLHNLFVTNILFVKIPSTKAFISSRGVIFTTKILIPCSGIVSSYIAVFDNIIASRSGVISNNSTIVSVPTMIPYFIFMRKGVMIKGNRIIKVTIKSNGMKACKYSLKL